MERREMITELFRERFGSEPNLWVRAPGRVDLMGSHTDYNLGFVLTLPISRDTWLAARANGSPDVRLHAANLAEDDSFSLDRVTEAPAKKWTRYVQGVASVLGSEGLRLAGFDAVIHSTVPLESGLSSSAALECATTVAFRELGGWTMPAERMARLCQRAENEFVGVNCGILDQYSSCLGQKDCALLLDCRDLSTRAAPIRDGIRVVISNTMSRRRLSGGEYGQRRADCERGAALLGVSALRELTPQTMEARVRELPEQVAKRCRFIVAESARAEAMAAALEKGDRDAIRELCAASFAGARDLYEICSAPMEQVMDAMLCAPGIIGARQAGAGFGGCMVALVDAARTDAFRSSVAEAYQSVTGLEPDIYPVEAAPGAGVLDQER